VIPKFNNYGELPPGIHEATFEEFEIRFSFSNKRKELIGGLKKAIKILKQVGCKIVYIDGSFVTYVELPNDFDGCWDENGVNLNLLVQLEPLFFDFDNMRKKQKEKFKGEFFPSQASADGYNNFIEFFQKVRFTNRKKGIIKINIL
jgi:hypothetical protein